MKASRSSPRIVVILAAVLAIVVAAVLVALSYRSGTVDSASGGRVVSASADLRLYSGIPQKGTMLGNPNAPVTIRLYEDFQCPYCGEFGRDTLPELVTRYVKTGKVKLVSEPLAFLGTDSVEAAKAALAAGEQDRYWEYHSLLFANQGRENSGYVTDGFLVELANRTPNLDVSTWSERQASGSDAELEAVQDRAHEAGVSTTPTLIVDGPDGREELEGTQPVSRIFAAIARVDGA